MGIAKEDDDEGEEEDVEADSRVPKLVDQSEKKTEETNTSGDIEGIVDAPAVEIRISYHMTRVNRLSNNERPIASKLCPGETWLRCQQGTQAGNK